MSEPLTRAEALAQGLCRTCRLFVAPGNGPALHACGNGDDKCPGHQPREQRKEGK